MVIVRAFLSLFVKKKLQDDARQLVSCIRDLNHVFVVSA